MAAGAPPSSDKPGAARGTSEVVAFRLTKDRLLLAAIEPWHGNQVVIYSPAEGDGLWHRHVIDDMLHEGHALVTGDFDGDGMDDHSRLGQQFKAFEIDPAMPAEGAVAADINGDGKLDLVVIAGRINQLVWYENCTPAPATRSK